MHVQQLRRMRLWSLTIFLILISSINSVTTQTECTLNEDCGTGYYCLHRSCEQCIPCEEIYNRHPLLSPLGKPICAKEEDDCGACLPGYVAHDLVAQRRSMKCFKEPQTEPSTDSSSSSYAWIKPTLAGCVILAVVAIMFLARHNWRRTPENKVADVEEPLILRPEQPTAPPAYQEQDPNACNEAFPLITATCINEGNTVELVNGCNTQAVPIYNVDVAADNSQNEVVIGQPDEDQEEHMDVINDAASLHLENTNDSTANNPSHGAPTPSQSNMSLHRSPSQEMPLCPGNRIVRASSDPILPTRRLNPYGGESYSQVHVELSNLRLNSGTVNSSSGTSITFAEADQLDGRLSDSTSNGSCDDSESEMLEESLPIDNVITERIFRDRLAQEEVSVLPKRLSRQESLQSSQESGFHENLKRRDEEDQSDNELSEPDPKCPCNHDLEEN